MKVRLNIQHKKANVKSVLLHADATIGRSTECNLRLASGQVSRKHCRLLINDDRVAVRDLGSSNGTFLNGQQLSANEESLVFPGAQLKIGAVTFTLEFEDPTTETHIRKDQPQITQPEQTTETHNPDDQVTPLGGNPVFQESPADDPPPLSDDLEETLNELSDAELEALLQEEGYEEDSDYQTIEFEEEETEDNSSQNSSQENTVHFSVDENSAPAETLQQPNESLAEPASLEDDTPLAPDEEDEENVMRFLQDLDD